MDLYARMRHRAEIACGSSEAMCLYVFWTKLAGSLPGLPQLVASCVAARDIAAENATLTIVGRSVCEVEINALVIPCPIAFSTTAVDEEVVRVLLLLKVFDHAQDIRVRYVLGS